MEAYSTSLAQIVSQAITSPLSLPYATGICGKEGMA
jgi:hypothetical protein